MEKFTSSLNLFNKTEVKLPFEDLSHVNVCRVKEAKFGIDLFIFLNMITYLPNTEFNLHGKDENSKKIKKIEVTVHKELPVLVNGWLIKQSISVNFKVIPRTQIQGDNKLQSNPDRVMLSGYSRFLVIPNKFIITSFFRPPEQTRQEELDEYLEYVEKVIGNAEYYPYFGFSEKGEGDSGEENKIQVLKLIYEPEKISNWRE